MREVPQLIKSGKYTRPALGIEADEQINERLNAITVTKGVVVLRVQSRISRRKSGSQGRDSDPTRYDSWRHSRGG